MVSSYILLKLFQKSNYERAQRDFSRDDEGCNNTTSAATRDSQIVNLCRICLKEGTIPIYGDENMPDISTAVCTFGDIEINDNDDYLHLCIPCYKLLEGAILFRKTAKSSDQRIRNRCLKNETKSDELSSDIDDSTPTTVVKNKQKTSSLLHNYFSAIINDDETQDKTTKKKILKVQCQICSKIITKAYYREHFALHDSSVTKYICDVCGKSFRQRCSYENHYTTHRTVFPYECKRCPYRGRNSALLNMHMRVHSGDYRYMCSECPARFLTKSNLNKHMLKHKEPTFKCDTCKRAFHSKLLLERHFEAEHLGIKRHLCNLCGKAFGYRKAMMRHQLDVHKREKKVNGRTPAYLEVEQKKLEGFL